MALLENFLQFFGSNKNDKKFEEPEIPIDKDNILPNSEEPELPILQNNNVLYSIDFNEQFTTIKNLILTYRDVATNHEVDNAIDEIENEAIVVEDNNNNITLNLDSIDSISENVKKKIKEEFEEILRLLNFKRKGSELFRKWYIDGRIWFQVLFSKNESKGIVKLNRLSPLDITRLQENGKIVYIYREDNRNKQKRNKLFDRSIANRNFEEGVKISEKNIVFVPSGLTDPEENFYISHLHKAIKPLNQLKLLEDSAVIYRITRAPERRVFYIDVGKLPKTKAENYVKGLMNKFKSSVVYDVKTGKVTENKNVMTMLEDFYLPSMGDSKGTKVETLQGGSQLGEIEDLIYFKKKLLTSLKVPYTRLDTSEPTIDLSGAGQQQLSRQEIKFQKFIKRLRSNFSMLFYSLLKTQLISKNIIGLGEWELLKNEIDFVWQTDSYFDELSKNEILQQRISLLDSMENYVGKYFSSDYIKREVLKQDEDEIKKIQKEIDANKEQPEEQPVEPQDNASIDNQNQ